MDLEEYKIAIPTDDKIIENDPLKQIETAIEIEAKLETEIDEEFAAPTIDSNADGENLDEIFEVHVKVNEISEVDSRRNKKSNINDYASKRNIAEGMMDIALLTANANQLRFILTYNTESKTFYISLVLITLSLLLQVAIGIAILFKRGMDQRRHKHHMAQANTFIVGGIFIVTVVNILLASFTTTETPKPQ